MAETLTNFVVGLGYDYDQKGQDNIESGIDSIKSKALQLGGVLAGAFGLKALTADFAKANDELGKFSQVFGVTANDAAALGRALEHEGGSIDSFLNQLQNIEQLRAGLLTGDAGFIAAAGVAGIDPSVIINAESATEAYIALGDQFQRLSQQERINAAQALGLDEASIRLLSQGTDQVEKLVEEQRKLRPVTEEMTKEAARFNDEMQDLGNNIGAVSDRISIAILPSINDLVGSMNNWFDVNKEVINSGLDGFLESIAENLDIVLAVITAIGASSTFGTLSKLGKVPIVGRALAATGTAGLSAAAVGSAGFAGFKLGEFIGDQINQIVLNDRIELTDPAQQRITGKETNTEQTFTERLMNTFSSNEPREVIMLDREEYFSPDDIPMPYDAFSNDLDYRDRRDNPARESKINVEVQSQPVQVDVRLNNQVFESAVINVQQRENRKTLNDLTSDLEG